ncbi:MAG: calcium/sodium antiporter [Oscillospiraceae bacterium]|nr:calcium/sodium antiporter [Oscillospiraceae bacterium]
MSIITTILLFALGIVLVVKGGDYFVDAASWIAETSGIPKLIVGATIVSFATTLPELLVSALAAIDGKVDIAAGNAVGSVTANLGLIMGIAIVCMPSVIRRKDYILKSVLMLGGALLLMLACQNGVLTLLPCVGLVLIFLTAMGENVFGARTAMRLEQPAEQKRPPMKKEVVTNVLKFVFGIAAIIIGARLLVDQGSQIALMLGVPERIVGVTVIAVGTSLPELVTTLSAIVKKEVSLSVGNIIGANIIDLTLILPVCSLLSGGSLPVSIQSIGIDLPVCLMVGALALLPALALKRFYRAQGFLMLAGYAGYVAYTCVVQ